MKHLILIAFLLTGCATLPSPPVEKPAEKPISECAAHTWCWDNLTENLLKEHGASLLAMEPKDAGDYCSSWKTVDRIGFYKTLIKAIVKRESNFTPNQDYKENFKNGAGETVISTGLAQVSYESCRSYGVKGATTASLKDPAQNLECVVKIGNRWAKDGYIGHSFGRQSATDNGHRGFARYFSTMRPGNSKDFVKNETMRFCK